ncbi:MAG: tRNA-(ms[2]io[6]A)-hydroxylase [Proteobacteria bacterium]|nr:tRNA-(ms[2]io[6]A)-hydroxylase [Pseudomonadota bacterium]
MAQRVVERKLPLRVFTPDGWGAQALTRPLSLLNDHAHLEKKAAQNALDLLPCWPDPEVPTRWVRILSSVARDEVQHLAIVIRLLERRGSAMTKAHRSTYAGALRKLVRAGRGPLETCDRLMVSSLIEARSCERFEILSRTAEDAELQKLYKSLWASEHGHYQVFLELASKTVSPQEFERRWEYMLDHEAEIIQEPTAQVGMHSWVL